MKISKRQMAGFSLLEALIAFLILSIGLLGMAGLQATALRNNHSAYLRSQAVVMAYDIMDRMRANRTVALAGNYARDFDDAKPTQVCTSVCSDIHMAAADEKEWVESLEKLPGGDGEITVDNTGLATVAVQWDDRRDASNLMTFQLSTKL
ncbi:MAG: type IV pilus modification protein PilV [Sedimenticola sp.]